jgi:hypothetical protein
MSHPSAFHTAVRFAARGAGFGDALTVEFFSTAKLLLLKCGGITVQLKHYPAPVAFKPATWLLPWLLMPTSWAEVGVRTM